LIEQWIVDNTIIISLYYIINWLSTMIEDYIVTNQIIPHTKIGIIWLVDYILIL